ncbi:MAG: hypothetical protein E7401_06200 [Ruminococcaceae bacterium]|nr:hypothetical protein [Oscillospiraceae bacterium]
MNKKYIVALILNIIPFFLSCLLYEGGIAISIMFFILQILINSLNYKWTNKITSYLFLNSVMLISSITSNKIITQLYYTNVSSDNGTLAVGDFEIKFTLAFILLMTLIGIVLRIVSKKNIKQ